jgi:hypothetical protein
MSDAESDDAHARPQTDVEPGRPADATPTREDTPKRGGDDTAARVRRGLDYALLGGFVLLGLFAALQFYLAADRTINVWVTREYRPPFKMVFNLVVLLVVGIGVSRQLRRLTGGGTDGTDDSTPDAATDGGVDGHPPETTPPEVGMGTEMTDGTRGPSGAETGSPAEPRRPGAAISDHEGDAGTPDDTRH